MTKLKKILAIIMIIIQLPYFTPKAIETYSEIPIGRPLKIAVLFYDYNDIFLSLIRKRFEEIQKENEDKVQFTFFNAETNNTKQLDNINKANQDGFDVIILSMVEKRKDLVEGVFSSLRVKNVPVILIAPDIPETSAFNANNKAFIVNSDAIESGIAQGKLIGDIWGKDKASMDKNKDNVLQYIMIKGRLSSPFAVERSRYSIKTLNDLGIKTQELASVTAEWDKETAKNMVTSLFLKYGNKIEAIISNNDAMAIGAIEALQKYGYNNGDKSKIISVFGFDAIDEAKDLIKKGYMIGTVFQDPDKIADAIYTIAINLLSDKVPTEGTNFKLNGKEIIVPLVYEPYTNSSK